MKIERDITFRFSGLLVTFFLLSQFSFSQNLEKLGKKDMVKISGGLAFNTITYYSSGLDLPRREPFTWYASGTMNVSILDVSLPFTYTYSNQGGKFTQPFNRTAINPSYKWIKSTIGLTTMSFSPYTLNGHLFLGAGLDLTPGKWKISVMAGRLNKEVPYDVVADNVDQIIYRRFGYGFKYSYENKGYAGSLIVFKARDNTSSIPIVPLNTPIKPQDNLVVSLGGKLNLIKQLFLEGEYAFSALTQNVADLNASEEASKMSFLNPLIQGNSTTGFFQAYKTSLKYQLKWMQIGFNYEHIDPGYKTLGGYYFNNDLNNYTLSPAFTLFNKKLNISGNTGFQRNNLGGDKAATTSRWVGSVSISAVPVQKMVVSGNYSNFSTFTKNRPATDPFYYSGGDTLNFYQLTQSASCMVSYGYGKTQNTNTVQLMYNFQQSTNMSGSIAAAGAFGLGVESAETGIPMNIHCANAAYSKQFKAVEASLTFAANVNRTISVYAHNLFIGPTVNFQKSLFSKKSTLSVGTTYNRQYQEEVLISNVFNHRVAFTFSPKFDKDKSGKMNFALSANWMQKLSLDSFAPDIHEVNVFVNLGYKF